MEKARLVDPHRLEDSARPLTPDEEEFSERLERACARLVSAIEEGDPDFLEEWQGYRRWDHAKNGHLYQLAMRSEAARFVIRKRDFQALLTVLPVDLPEEVLGEVDSILQKQFHDKPVVRLSDLPVEPWRSGAGAKVYVWQGDITTLAVDAIVNAANKFMLGCTTPFHACIDNAIHARAGPRLRQECRRIMEAQGHLEPTGVCKITKAYLLPSKHVLHTVGPIIRRRNASGGWLSAKTHEDEHETLRPDLLASCYVECLSAAAQQGLQSVAFCCISTGVFGYPEREGAMVALETVRGWLDQHPDASVKHVVFNVFTDNSTAIYRELVPTYFQPQQ